VRGRLGLGARAGCPLQRQFRDRLVKERHTVGWAARSKAHHHRAPRLMMGFAKLSPSYELISAKASRFGNHTVKQGEILLLKYHQFVCSNIG